MSERLLVISDIHGHRKPFPYFLNEQNIIPKDQLVLMGDYVNNGPDLIWNIKIG